MTGVGAAKAGPAVILSFAIAGLICACAALAYAEMATMIPASGSAYTYSYVVIGELVAWIIGWSLILEYSLVVSAVAVGWSGYAAPLLHDGVGYPMALAQGPELGGIVNLPAIFIIAVVAGLLIYGTRESATVNAVLVLVKIVALIVFVAVTLPYFDAANFDPFMPYGFPKTGAPGAEVGVMAAAAIIFFAFYGFDAIATAAEEAKDPGRDLAIGIVGSMVACVIIYMAVAGAAIGALAYTRFANSPEPLALILRELGQPWAARYLAASAVIALPTVILAFFYGQSRIFFVMARDGLLPRGLAQGVGTRLAGADHHLHRSDRRGARRHRPARRPRRARQCRDPDRLHRRLRLHAGHAGAGRPTAPRRFATPWPWVVGIGGIVGCLYLLYSLPWNTQRYFLLAQVVGLALYLVYGFRRSPLGAGRAEPLQYSGLLVGVLGLFIAAAALLYGPPVAPGGLGLYYHLLVYAMGLVLMLVGAILFGSGAVAERLARSAASAEP